MINVFSKKMYRFIPLVLIGIIAVSLMIIFVILPVKENAGIPSHVTPSANITSTTTPPAKEELETGKGWVKTVDLTHVCKEPCPGEFSLGLVFPVQQTSDGGYVTAGFISNLTHTADGQTVDMTRYIYLLKMDVDGNQWKKTYKTYEIGSRPSVKQTSDGGYIFVVGRYWKAGGGGHLIKTDANGNVLWNNTFGPFCGGWHSEIPRSIQQTTDGGYVVVGETLNCAGKKGGNGVFLLKTDASGNKIWEKVVTGRDFIDTLESVFQASDGGYLAIGHTSSFGVKQELDLIKVDANGKDMWEKTFGEYTYDVGSSVRQTSDGDFILIQGKNFPFTQRSEYERYAFKLDAKGNKLWEKTLKFSSFPEVRMISAVQTSDGGYMAVAKKAGGEGGENDFYLVKLDENGHEMWYKWHKIVLFAIDNTENRLEILLIQQTSEGGYTLSGVSSYNPPDITYPEAKYYIIKTDANGNV